MSSLQTIWMHHKILHVLTNVPFRHQLQHVASIQCWVLTICTCLMLHFQQRRYAELPFLLLIDCSFSMYPVNRLFSWKVVAATLWMSAPVSWSTCSRSDSSFFQLPALTWYEHSADAMLVFERIPSTSVSLVACIHRMHQVIALTPIHVITSLHVVTSKLLHHAVRKGLIHRHSMVTSVRKLPSLASHMHASSAGRPKQPRCSGADHVLIALSSKFLARQQDNNKHRNDHYAAITNKSMWLAPDVLFRQGSAQTAFRHQTVDNHNITLPS